MALKPVEEEKIIPTEEEEAIKKRNQKIAIGFIVLVIIVIAFLLIWPLINKGTLVFKTSNIGGQLTYCRITALQEDELSPHRGSCPDSFLQNTVTINNSASTFTLPVGNYYLYYNLEKFAPVESSVVIKFGQGSEVSIDLLPLVSKYIDDYTAAISTNPASPYLIKFVTGYQDPDAQTGYFEKYVIEDIRQPDISLMDLSQFSDISDINWSPDNSQFFMTAILKDDTEKKKKKYLVNLINQTVNESSLNYSQIAWSANSQKIFYVYYDIHEDPNFVFPDTNTGQQGALVPLVKGPNHNSLTQANPDGSDWQTLIKLDETLFNNPKIIPSPDGQRLLLISQDQLAYIYNILTGQLERYTDLDYIYDASWSPNSQLILLETYYQNQPALYISQLASQYNVWTDARSFIYKTVWKDDSTLFIAEPNYIPGPNDVPYKSIDLIKKITFSYDNEGQIKSERTPIMASSPTINDAVSLLYLPDQNTLYLLDYENYLNILPLQ